MSVERFTSYDWPAPAKINLFLHIVGRRPDGYHLLQTVFQFLDFGDTLHFTVRPDGAISRRGSLPGVAPEADLTVRAAHALQRASGVSLGVDIDTVKRIPLGGGLGGGSSDAATTLVALNRLWGVDWDDARLCEIGVALGADVPVFVRGHAAWAEGVGEKLTPLNDLPEPWYVVVTPPCQVPTGEIFAAPDLTRNVAPIKIRRFLDGAGINVCVPVVRKRYPLVAQALDWLSQHGDARMSGTGASVFVAAANEADARHVLAELPSGWQGFAAQGMNRSRLLYRLDQCAATGERV